MLALLSGLLAGCSGSSAGGEQPPPNAAPTAAATTAVATTTAAARERRGAAEEVLQSYRAFWDDVIAAGRAADWQHPRLDDHATGEALRSVRVRYLWLRRQGLVVRGRVDLRPEVLEVGPARAVVYDCNSTRDFLKYDARTGALRDRSVNRRDGQTVTLVRQAGTWKVAKVVTEVGRCAR